MQKAFGILRSSLGKLVIAGKAKLPPKEVDLIPVAVNLIILAVHGGGEVSRCLPVASSDGHGMKFGELFVISKVFDELVLVMLKTLFVMSSSFRRQ